EEVLRLKLVNTAAAAETLSAVTFTNTTVGPGSVADRDAEWQSLQLTFPGRTGVVGVGRQPTGTFSGGTVTFAGLDEEIAAGDSLVLRVTSGASLLARDGDQLDLAVADSLALSFSRPVDLRGTFPVAPAGAFAVDGMVAAQLPVNTKNLASNLLTGSVLNLSLDVLIPANGYEADTLRAINLRNDGTALPGTDLERIEAWVDLDADGVFEPNGDDASGWIAQLVDTGNRWEATGISVPVPAGGRRLFISCDVADAAAFGATFRPLLTVGSPGSGLIMASNNDGPMDLEVGNPASQTITTVDRVTLGKVAVAPGTASPDAQDVVVLRITATNDYTVPKTLTGLTVTNRTTGPGAPSQTDLDSEVGQLRLRADSLATPDLAQAIFTSGRGVFNGFNVTLQAGETRDLLVTADLEFLKASDGDVIGAELSGEADVTFSDATTAVASWPLDSGAAWTVDGMVSAQITSHGAPNATLGPSEGPALALDVTLPANGYRDDILRGLTVVNVGTATPADIGQMELWRDGGDG
ncbi:MAG: hypothetical protein HKN12_01320, partial [Gemmatimonadetes bacterium]|nr:hypothetical protein [Gemmatimonadota bacterium]